MNLRDIARTAFALAGIALVVPPCVRAEPALDLGDRIVIDGFSDEFTADENLLQIKPSGGLEESTIDSQWGPFNDLNRIKLTWDANFVYVAVDGFIFDNNTMIFFDTRPQPDGSNPGLTSLSQVNSWRRAVSFDNGNAPDLFVATWDGNTTPQAWTFSGPNQVTQVPQASFPTVASFSRDIPGRSMEAAIPWDVFFLGAGEHEFNPAYGDTVYQLPGTGAPIKIVAWITTGSDGLGGPDSAPDNLSGHQSDSAVPVVLDNFLRIDMDRFDAEGNPNPDGVPDFNVPVRAPVEDLCAGLSDEECAEAYAAAAAETFFLVPPIRGTALQIGDIDVAPKAIAPDLGDELGFRFTVTPRIDDDALRRARRLAFSAEVFDLNGTRVRTLYRDEEFTIEELEALEPPLRNRFDGRDDDGRPLEGGMYLLRVVLEPDQDQIEAPLAVVR